MYKLFGDLNYGKQINNIFNKYFTIVHGLFVNDSTRNKSVNYN